MNALSLLSYAFALFVAVSTPGPAMLAVISRGLSRGVRPAFITGLGVALADVALGLLALLGLAALMATVTWLLVVIKYAGAAYLIFLGIRMWRNAIVSSETSGRNNSGNFLLGTSIALSNPKAILFHASLMPIIVDLRELNLTGGAMIIAIIFGTNLLVMSGYAVLASRGADYFRTPARVRLLGRTAGGTMVSAGAIVALR